MDKVQRFTLVVSKVQLRNNSSPDSPSKFQIVVNGTVPGPAIHIQTGALVIVTVVNEIFDDLVTIHWHGLDQRGTPFSDGVPGVSQCPISNHPIDNIFTYSFRVAMAGTYWYHGHFNHQYPDGLYGPLIAHSSDEVDNFKRVGANYDDENSADAWTLMIADWYDVPAIDLLKWYLSPDSHGDEPIPDSYTINNLFEGELTLSVDNHANRRVRLINAASLSMFNISIEGLPLQVIEIDGASVFPIDLPYILLDVSQ